jgi:hypothetical protein
MNIFLATLGGSAELLSHRLLDHCHRHCMHLYRLYYIAKDDLRETMRLNGGDWFILTYLASAMKYFEDVTKALESHATDAEYGSMSEPVPAVENPKFVDRITATKSSTKCVPFYCTRYFTSRGISNRIKRSARC